MSGFYLSKEEFLEKIRESDIQELVEDFNIGRYELHVRVNGRGEVYVSPNVYTMSSGEDLRFVDNVEEEIEKKDMIIARSRR